MNNKQYKLECTWGHPLQYDLHFKNDYYCESEIVGYLEFKDKYFYAKYRGDKDKIVYECNPERGVLEEHINKAVEAIKCAHAQDLGEKIPDLSSSENSGGGQKREELIETLEKLKKQINNCSECEDARDFLINIMKREVEFVKALEDAIILLKD